MGGWRRHRLRTSEHGLRRWYCLHHRTPSQPTSCTLQEFGNGTNSVPGQGLCRCYRHNRLHHRTFPQPPAPYNPPRAPQEFGNGTNSAPEGKAYAAAAAKANATAAAAKAGATEDTQSGVDAAAPAPAEEDTGKLETVVKFSKEGGAAGPASAEDGPDGQQVRSECYSVPAVAAFWCCQRSGVAAKVGQVELDILTYINPHPNRMYVFNADRTLERTQEHCLLIPPSTRPTSMCASVCRTAALLKQVERSVSIASSTATTTSLSCQSGETRWF